MFRLSGLWALDLFIVLLWWPIAASLYLIYFLLVFGCAIVMLPLTFVVFIGRARTRHR